jgi:hypothetical protein
MAAAGSKAAAVPTEEGRLPGRGRFGVRGVRRPGRFAQARRREPADGEDKRGAFRGEDKHGILHFTGITSLADFKAAFDQSFSRVPLQDEHPDWPADIRRAIASRQLIDGMTKRQAYCITGPPASFEQTAKDGKQIEVWRLKTNRMPRYTFLSSRRTVPCFVSRTGNSSGGVTGMRGQGQSGSVNQAYPKSARNRHGCLA